jgi:tetratricopeptide (TPR) repeat protein
MLNAAHHVRVNIIAIIMPSLIGLLTEESHAMSTPPDPSGDLDPPLFPDSPYAAGAPHEHVPQPPPGYPYGQPPAQWEPLPFTQEGAYGNDPSLLWNDQEQNAAYPRAGQPWESFPNYVPPTYAHEGYMGEISQPPYIEQSSGIQPWTIPASGPMLSSRSWPDISLDTLDPPYRAQPPLARPLPRWLLIISSVAAGAVLVVMALMGKDLAGSALHAGLAAGAMALIVLFVTIIRSLGGMAARGNERRQVQYTGAMLVMVILLALSGTGIGLQAPIHHLQAGMLAGSQQWQRAINELRLAGETPPTSEALAQVYDEWGEHLSSSQHYADAVTKFAFVISTYGGASQGLKRAEADSITAYVAWGRQAALLKDYKGATQHFDGVLKQSYCLVDCHNLVRPLDATAYYKRAETSLSTQDYADAASAFAALTTRFTTAPEAQEIHGDYADALLGLGQQQIASSSCTSAVPTYQKLANGFADTAAGQQAITAMQAPQPVLGQLTTADPSLKIHAILAVNLKVNAGAGSHSPTIASFDTVAVAPLANSGTFQFAPVPQGHYPLLWQFSASGKLQTITFIKDDGSNDPAIVANVGPLCPYNFGTITQALSS